LILVGLLIVIVFGGILFSLLRGAPYVPMHTKNLNKVFSFIAVSKKGILVDLGSGDGMVLKAASERGIVSVGVEINPLLVLFSKFRLRHHKDASVVWQDMFKWDLPVSTEAIFVFAAGPFIDRIEEWLQGQADDLDHPLQVISYGFRFADRIPAREDGAVLLYLFEAR
jgi:hypothetical protein